MSGSRPAPAATREADVAAAALAQPQEVHVAPLSPTRFEGLLAPRAWSELQSGIEAVGRMMEGRVIWNVNSTAVGGGVAEMLRSLVAYSRGVGLDVRWVVMTGEPAFFQVTKRLHNLLHGSPGDGGELGEDEARIYEAVCAANAEHLATAIRPQDLVILHDPQTAGLARRIKATGAPVVWRSHIGVEEPNELVHRAWDFLSPHLDRVDVCVFSRWAYAPPWAKKVRTEVIQPSIDAFSPKNQDLSADSVRAILSHVGLVVGDSAASGMPSFSRQDGTPGRVDHLADVVSAGPPPTFDTPLVVQVSRWDRLKDPIGVMTGFAEHVADRSAAHLVLAGPSVRSVADDPEGAEVFDEAEATWRKLPQARRGRIHLACLPMIDIEENAAIVNALQRQASVIVQKSLQEGFGLTVAEGMWKSRPVVASAVGGIKEQIEDGVTGMLLEDPRDLPAFGDTVLRLLDDRELARSLGVKARQHVLENFLADRHSLQYIKLFGDILR